MFEIAMTFFYSTSKSPDAAKSRIDVWKMNGTNAYLRHYENYLFLQFVSTNPLSSEQERRQARAEMTLCEKKLEFWRRHPRYDQTEALRCVTEMKRNWEAKSAP